MNATQNRPPVDEIAELEAYLATRQRVEAPAPGEAGFPSGLAGELLALAQATHPDPVFAARLEERLRRAGGQAARTQVNPSLSESLQALWRTLNQPERKPAMKRLIAFTLAGMFIVAILFISLQLFVLQPAPPELVLATPAAQTPLPAETMPVGATTPVGETPGVPTLEPAIPIEPVASSFTPQPVPAQPPSLPSLAQAYGLGYGGSGGGSVPEGMQLSLGIDLPVGPAEMPAYYRLENTPVTMDQAVQLAAQWGLPAQLYLPGWMLNVTPEQVERSYYAIQGMQVLSIENAGLSFLDLAVLPSYDGHQYPPASLPAAEQALQTATGYLAERGLLDYSYQADLSRYHYGTVGFYRLLDGWRLDSPAAEVTLDLQGQVGAAQVDLETYQSIGSYPLVSAQEAWAMLQAGDASERLRISYYTQRDRNPQYWGRVYPAGERADLFGRPVLLTPVDPGMVPYIQLGNLVLSGDLSTLTGYLQADQGGYIHAWGQVQEVDGARQLLLDGWEAFDEFSGYFNGTVRRTAVGDFLELEDGRMLGLPGLPADLPADTPVYAQGGLVGDTLQWFILQAHPWDEGQLPPDLSQALVTIDQVELVYLAPDLVNLPPEQALDPAYRMLQPTWRFNGWFYAADGEAMVFQAYVGAGVNP